MWTPLLGSCRGPGGCPLSLWARECPVAPVALGAGVDALGVSHTEKAQTLYNRVLLEIDL